MTVSTHKPALAALLLLYRNVLDVDLPWLTQFEHPKAPVRLPDVLELARDSDCSACGCEFVVLANRLDVKLMTMNKKILKAFPKRAFPLLA